MNPSTQEKCHPLTWIFGLSKVLGHKSVVLKPKLTFRYSEELPRTTNVRALPPGLLLNRDRMESGHGYLRRITELQGHARSGCTENTIVCPIHSNSALERTR